MRYTALLLLILPLLLTTGCDDASTDALAAEVAALRTELETLQGTVIAQETTLADLETTVGEQATTLAAQETRILGLEDGGFLTQAAFDGTPAAGIETTDIDAWNETAAEVDGTSDGVAGSRIDDLEAADTATQLRIDGVEGNLTSLDGRATTLETGLNVAEADIDGLETDKLGRLTAPLTTLNVPGDHALISDALAWLDGYSIDGDAVVSILVAAGTQVEPEAVVVRHPDGDRIEIRGSGVSSTFLEFADSDGIVVTGGGALGYLGELTLTSTTGTGSGVLVTDSSALKNLGSVDVFSWGVAGVHVRRGASLVVTETADIELVGNEHGVLVQEGAFADVGAAEAEGSLYAGFLVDGGVMLAQEAEATNSGTYGFAADHGGLLLAEESHSHGGDISSVGYDIHGGSVADLHSATAEQNVHDGIVARYGSYVDAAHATAEYNDRDGFVASNGSVLAASSSFSRQNGSQGYESAYHSTIYAPDSTATGNLNVAYRAAYNGYMRATALDDTSISSTYHDTNDFIYGVP